MRVEPFYGDINELTRVMSAFITESTCDDFGISLDLHVVIEDVKRLITHDNSDLLVLIHEDGIVGMMGLRINDSPLGEQQFTNEHYWYVIKEYRGIASIRMVKAAELWAKNMGCSHILLNASYMASDMHDMICKLYDKMSMKRFETVYIKDIKEV